jgi:hypothetical protein
MGTGLRSEVHAVPFPGARMNIQISKDVGCKPRWSRDGQEIYFVGKDGMLTDASLKYVKGAPQVVSTKRLFKLTYGALRVLVALAPSGIPRLQEIGIVSRIKKRFH